MSARPVPSALAASIVPLVGISVARCVGLWALEERDSNTENDWPATIEGARRRCRTLFDGVATIGVFVGLASYSEFSCDNLEALVDGDVFVYVAVSRDNPEDKRKTRVRRIGLMASGRFFDLADVEANMWACDDAFTVPAVLGDTPANDDEVSLQRRKSGGPSKAKASAASKGAVSR
ncbi:MAG: hypothetical protein NVS3B20_27070 [Polyangiales bacterium]